LTLLIVLCAGCAATLHAGQNVSAAADPPAPPDAEFELWQQDWTLKPDGSLVYHEKRHVRLNSDRVYRSFGNPRITYNTDTDELEVLVARTRLPDGKYVELADYSTVEVSPDAAAGWPAFANVRQIAMVMGGIEANCVLELEHQITTKAGARPYLAADLRIDHRYPVLARTVSVTLPRGKELSPIVSGLAENEYRYSLDRRSDGSTTHRWVFAELGGQPREPQALPWYESGVRLAFATGPDADTWIRERLAAIETAADESPLLTKLAQDWAKDESSQADKLRALQKKLSGSFRFVSFDVAWRPPTPRRASDVIRHNYGLPAESAAVLLSLAWAAGVAAQPALLVADGVWDDGARQASMVAAYVVVHDGPDGLEIWHPQNGRIQRDQRWAGHTLLAPRGSRIERTPLPAWLDADESRCAITGRITVDEKGKWSGKLSIKTSGLFVSPNALETADGQKRRVNAIVRHVLPGAKVKSYDLKSLAPGTFDVEAEVESSEPLEKLHECYRLTLPETSPAFADVSVPLSSARRLTSARLVGPFDERIELTIEWPEKWAAQAVPGGVAPCSGGWGTVAQSVSADEHELTLARHTRLQHRDLAPTDVVALREPLNELRADHTRTLLLRP
jgi:transglutaminase-like putative cysteine protease